MCQRRPAFPAALLLTDRSSAVAHQSAPSPAARRAGLPSPLTSFTLADSQAFCKKPHSTQRFQYAQILAIVNLFRQISGVPAGKPGGCAARPPPRCANRANVLPGIRFPRAQGAAHGRRGPTEPPRCIASGKRLWRKPGPSSPGRADGHPGGSPETQVAQSSQ